MSTTPINYFTIESEDIWLTNYIPTKEGYIFDGWYTSDSYTNQISVIVNGTHANITLYAKWNFIPKVIFDSNGGTPIESIKLNNGSYIDFASTDSYTPIRDGYKFLGWYDSNNNLVNYINSSDLSKDITLYALWEEEEADYNINLSFYANGEEFYIDSDYKVYVYIPIDCSDYLYTTPYQIFSHSDMNCFVQFFSDSDTVEQGLYLTVDDDNSTIVSSKGYDVEYVFSGDNIAGLIMCFNIISNFPSSILASISCSSDIKVVKDFGDVKPEKRQGCINIIGPENEFYFYVSKMIQPKYFYELGSFASSLDGMYMGFYVADFDFTDDKIGIFLQPSGDIDTIYLEGQLVSEYSSYSIYKFILTDVSDLLDKNCSDLDTFYLDDSLVYFINYEESSSKKVTINFISNGGTLVGGSRIQGYVGEDVNLPRPSKEGLNFSGWYNSETDEFVDINYNFPNEDVTLYAKYGYTSYGEYTNTVTFVANKDYYIAVSDSMTNEDKANSCSGLLTRLGSFSNSISSDVDGLYIGWYSPNGDENFKGCLDLDGIFNDIDVFAYFTFVSDEDGFDLYKFSFTEEQIYELQGYCCDILTYEDTEFYDLIHFVLE